MIRKITCRLITMAADRTACLGAGEIGVTGGGWGSCSHGGRGTKETEIIYKGAQCWGGGGGRGSHGGEGYKRNRDNL